MLKFKLIRVSLRGPRYFIGKMQYRNKITKLAAYLHVCNCVCYIDKIRQNKHSRLLEPELASLVLFQYQISLSRYKILS